jgi:hypothetical protein
MKSCADAHSLLHLLIAKASLEGNIGTASIYVPLTEITDSEGPTFTDDAAGTVLKVTVTTSWESADDVEDLLETNFEDPNAEEAEEEEDNAGHTKDKGHRGDPNKDSGSH